MKSQKYSRSNQAKLSILMKYNQNKYITLARINKINYCLKSISEVFKNRPSKPFCVKAIQ